ncbi:MAG: hypothetical protein ACP5VR_04890 [Acidimicrobiales bacterium]
MATCPHGFPQGECLICQTLGNGPVAPSTRAKLKERQAEKASSLKGVGTSGPATLAPRPTRDLPTTGLSAERATMRHGWRAAWALIAALVIAGTVIWAFAGLFTLAFHVAEYVVLVALASWAGYKVGYASGRRHRE